MRFDESAAAVMRRCLAAALLLAGAAGQYDPDACESWCARSFPYTCSNAGCTGCMDPKCKRPARPPPKQKKVEYYL